MNFIFLWFEDKIHIYAPRPVTSSICRQTKVSVPRANRHMHSPFKVSKGNPYYERLHKQKKHVQVNTNYAIYMRIHVKTDAFCKIKLSVSN